MRPLAIVGQACILPHASSPRALWELVVNGRSAIRDVPAGRFRIDPRLVAGTTKDSVDKTWSTAGGYVEDFTFSAAGLDVDAPGLEDLGALDPLFHWVLSAGRDALVDAGFDVPLAGVRAGAVLGNLSFPTELMTLLGEQRALDRETRKRLGAPWSVDVDERNEHMSGLPAHLLARALRLDAGAFCLDAACASSLYALRLAACALDDGRADVMLAGAVNRTDSLFLHVGFCALQALSATGRSRPFDVDADGLVPAEGCGVVALMRLEDAVAQKRNIRGVIRGIGLSNDGRSRNLLAPSSEGQQRALRQAWQSAQLSPSTCDYVECHATGTHIGDRTEIDSVRAVFADVDKPLLLGSLKSNLGHLITAAGVAGLIKVVEAMARGTLPPSIGVTKPIVDDARVRVVRQSEPWPVVDGRPRRAGVSAFGFGGNNAHVVVESWEPTAAPPSTRAFFSSATVEASPKLAVVALSRRRGPGADVELDGLRFPPNDLKEALPQQLLAFGAARDCVADLVGAVDIERVLPRERTAVLIGMSTDMAVTWPGLRWRSPEIARRLAPGNARFVDAVRESTIPPLGAQSILGCMPNIPANRLNVQLDVRGPGFTVSAEELSGARALDVARELIAHGDVDAAVVGAVDAQPGDAGEAVVVVVMSAARASELALPILATLADGAEGGSAAAASGRESAVHRLSRLVDGATTRAARLDRSQVALLFGTATSMEPNALAALRQAFPDVDAALAGAVGHDTLDAVFAKRFAPDAPCLAELASASATMQLYAGIVRDALAIDFGRVAGISLGESNAMHAARVWTDLGQMFVDMRESRLFDGKLFPPRQPWRAVVVRAPRVDVERACAGRDCSVLVVHADDEVELGGAPADIDAVLRELRALSSSLPLPAMPEVHCARLLAFADDYRKFHRRKTSAVDVVCYSHGAPGGPGPVKLDDDSVADALLAQGHATVDFPALLRRMVSDGVRVLIDCSPRGLAGQWARRSLPAGVDVLSLGTDLASVRAAVTRLAAAGVAVDVTRVPRERGRALHVPARKPPGPLPPVPVVVESMPAPPRRPRITPVAERETPAPAPAALAQRHVDSSMGDEAFAAVVAAGILEESEARASERGAADVDVETMRAARESALDAHRAALDAMARAHGEFMAHRDASARRMIALNGAVDVDGGASASADDDAVAPAASERRPDVLWDRAELEVLASGRISDVWGPTFAVQDDFRRQVRMPEPPLLLADRVMSIDAQPGVLEKDRSIVTETDVTSTSWYLHEGRCPAGVLIETGQADLLLVSYMGVDFENRGERVYRLLGCDLEYTAPLPLAGSTLRHDIHVDGYATAPMMSGADTRIFFFHSDTDIVGSGRVLQVRNGQAGFFTDDELARSGGILWKPADVDARALAALPHAAPPAPSTKRAFSRDELAAWSRGDARACFGFVECASHVRTPKIPSDPLLLIDRVSDVDFTGGPWGRGYLRAELALDDARNSWFLQGHFKDDPCMPGTLMFEGCLETLAIYLGAAGFTRSRDGFRFEPAQHRVFKLRCRGQATPSSKRLVYEVFVRALVDGPEPRVVADILVTVDGLKSLHCEAVELALVCDWPLSSQSALERDGDASAAVAPGTERALLATGIGRPSEAFPGMYEKFDEPGRRVPRLPGPPYHFMTRVVDVSGPARGSLLRNENAAGTEVIVEYDVPRDAWYFDDADGAGRSQGARMPFAVLLEVALQPCGWVSTWVGSALTGDDVVCYRNLDGRARVHREVTRDIGTLVTRARMTKSSSSSGMIIQELDFAVTTRDGAPVFDGATVFGFFPPAALARQVGVGSTDAERARLVEKCAPPSRDGVVVDLRARPARYCAGKLALPGAMLTMIDRVVAWDGRYLRTEKDVDAGEWFFRAHFFQDPVQPGSLGVEAMVQALMWCAIHEDGARYEANPRARPRFEALAVGVDVTWKYRGQVVPTNRLVQVELDEVTRADDGAGRVLWRADGSLWVDGTRIYRAPGLTLRVVDDA